MGTEITMHVFGMKPVEILQQKVETKKRKAPEPLAEKKTKKQKKKKKWSIYEFPIADTHAQMDRVLTPGYENRYLHILIFTHLSGSDYVRRSNFILGYTSETQWEIYDEMRKNGEIGELISYSGTGPYKVHLHGNRLIQFLENTLDDDSKMSKLEPGIKERSKLRPTKSMYKATIRRLLWTLTYNMNQVHYPDAFPDCLEIVDGKSVWGWVDVLGQTQETCSVSVTVPEESLGQLV